MFAISSTRKMLFTKLFVAALLILCVLPIPMQTVDASALAAVSCQCVVYIKNRYQLSGSAGSAKDMGPYLQNRGFVQVKLPYVGAVVIMKPSFKHGVSSVHGHVAVITAVSQTSTSWNITVRGANQGGSLSEYGCNNVGNWANISYPKSYGSSMIEFWTRNFALGRPTTVSSYYGNGYEGFRATDGNSETRWASSLNEAISIFTIDLSTSRSFDRVSIAWTSSYATHYYIGWSSDNITFQEVEVTAASRQTIVTLLGGVRTARYVRVRMDAIVPGKTNYSFYEVRVFANGNPASPEDALPLELIDPLEAAPDAEVPSGE